MGGAELRAPALDRHTSDEALFAAYAAGDRRAFAQLFSRHAPRLTRIMARGLRADLDANDLVQQTFLQVHRARRDFDPSRPLRPWLLTVAMNVKRGALRSARRRRETTSIDDCFAAPERTPPTERASRARWVHLAVATLSDKQRAVIELHYFEGLSFAEIAVVLDIKLSAAKVRAHRGYKALRATLEQQSPKAP
jgi:RNA polymerase sigma-70 factor (ECF subfamily)